MGVRVREKEENKRGEGSRERGEIDKEKGIWYKIRYPYSLFPKQ